MYLPIIFGYEVYNDVPVFLGFFYKFINQCIKYNWPIICQNNYFFDPDTIEKFNLNSDNLFKYHGATKVNYKQLDKVDKYIIPDELTTKIALECGGIDSAWINIMKDRFFELEDFIENTINLIEEKYKSNIKAVLVWRHNESIYSVCKKKNIKLIEMEFSTFRYPFYNELISYFQFSNKYSTDEFEERYNKFKKESNEKLPILTRKELLALFLAKDKINYINKLNDPVVYEMGIALGLQKDYESKANDCISNEDIIEKFKPYFSEMQTIYRPHPSSNFVDLKNTDTSKFSADFILKCRRVASVLSNISFESMLFGRTSYILGSMPFKSLSNSTFSVSDEIVSLQDLNYVMFAFLTPYDIMLEKEYLDFRLSNPSEGDIYLKHIKYYLKKRNIPYSVLNLSGNKRLSKILEYEGYDNFWEITEMGIKNVLAENEKLIQENIKLKQDVKNPKLDLKTIIKKIKSKK